MPEPLTTSTRRDARLAIVLGVVVFATTITTAIMGSLTAINYGAFALAMVAVVVSVKVEVDHWGGDDA